MSKDTSKKNTTNTIAELEAIISQQKQENLTISAAITEVNSRIAKRDKEIADYKDRVIERDQIITEKDEYIKTLDEVIYNWKDKYDKLVVVNDINRRALYTIELAMVNFYWCVPSLKAKVRRIINTNRK